MRNIFTEILRLWPPFLGAYRVTNTDIEVGDFHVPKGYVNAILIISKLHNMDRPLNVDGDMMTCFTYIIGTESFVQRLLHIGIQKYFHGQKNFYLHVGIMRIRMIRTKCSGLDLDLMLVLESVSCAMS